MSMSPGTRGIVAARPWPVFRDSSKSVASPSSFSQNRPLISVVRDTKLRIFCLMPVFWIVSASLSQGGQNGPIHLKTRDLTAGSEPAVRALQAPGPGSRHLLVQLSRAPAAADLLELRRRGARVVGSAPDGGITISIDQPISFDGLPVEWAG